MSSDTLREHLSRTPFHPIALFPPSGKIVAVNHPELFMFTETGRTLIVTQGERVMLIDVATVDAVKTAAE